MRPAGRDSVGVGGDTRGYHRAAEKRTFARVGNWLLTEVRDRRLTFVVVCSGSFDPLRTLVERPAAPLRRLSTDGVAELICHIACHTEDGVDALGDQGFDEHMSGKTGAGPQSMAVHRCRL